MKKEGRYNVSDSIEAQFEPGSNNTVLRNKLGITDPNEMDQVEAQALINATDALIHEYDAEHQFCAADICHLHQTWLGNVTNGLANIGVSTSARMIFLLPWRLRSQN